MTPQQQWIPRINSTLCDGCRQCIVRCPTGALGEAAGKAVVVTPQACTYCAICEVVCPTGAIGLPYRIVFLHEQPKHDEKRH